MHQPFLNTTEERGLCEGERSAENRALIFC
uniref:Uncharacterized protein n=1 Tax=Anguilla anguilla TaxID=7936 RepID=A0A0E9P951_ANGAN